jgi:hypothetical protein
MDTRPNEKSPDGSGASDSNGIGKAFKSSTPKKERVRLSLITNGQL